MERSVVDTRQVVLDLLESLIRRRGGEGPEVLLESDLYEDLDMDSLEVAELSAALEDELRRDPFTEGLVPRTPAEVIAFYG